MPNRATGLDGSILRFTIPKSMTAHAAAQPNEVYLPPTSKALTDFVLAADKRYTLKSSMKTIKYFPYVFTVGLLGFSCAALAQSTAVADEQIANDLAYCAVVSNDLQNVTNGEEKQSWEKRKSLYLAIAASLTSKDYALARVSVANMKQSVVLKTSNNKLEAVSNMFAATLTKCNTHMQSMLPRLKELESASNRKAPFVPAVQTVNLQIPHQNWHISFDAPVMMKISESEQPEQYSYWGSSGRFTLSIFVEPPKCNGGNTHADVHDCFMKKIAPTTATSSQSPAYYRVERKLPLPQRPGLITTHINYLFAHDSKWVDVHISGDDEAAIKRFDETMHYGLSHASQAN